MVTTAAQFAFAPTDDGRIRSGVLDWWESIVAYPQFREAAEAWLPRAKEFERRAVLKAKL